MEAVIVVEKLRKEFRTKIRRRGLRALASPRTKPEVRTVRAVDGISLTVERGEILAFIGPNGAGKSTTIKLITGILHPDSADTLSVLGLNPQRQRKALSYRIGTVFGQKSQLWFHLPPLDSFRLLGDIYDLDRGEVARRIDELAESFEIADYLRVPVRKLSLGERIRCEIVASMLHRPEILFLDEPTIGLDVVVKQRIRELIARINAEQQTTVFLTSHDTGDIEKLCKRVVVVNHGRIVLDDNVKNLKYSFFNRKIVELRLDAPLSLDCPGVTVLKEKGNGAKLEVDLAVISTEKVIERLVRTNTLLDLTITNPPLEEVIADIYGGGTPVAPAAGIAGQDAGAPGGPTASGGPEARGGRPGGTR